ncbi:OmpA family protein [Pontibacter sp. G13]|uniref:OmpA family protein n=1 Tax=Pontibacter sp. G13 TaxID=3074898 RepID=UPI00288A97C1|nr:OmpA family protein [Pontibacter sp. G13]WNJ18300.1 OmpA family protein [Pontibacter sp. G13]
MNQYVVLGVATFLLWGGASNWWYVCKIKGECGDSTPTVEMAIATPKEQAQATLAESPQPPKPNDSPAESADSSAVESAGVASSIPPSMPTDSATTVETARVAAPSPIHFHSDQITFQRGSDRYLNRSSVMTLLDSLKQAIGESEIDVVIVGHTCDLGTEALNQAMGIKRAERLMKDLTTRSFHLGEITIESQGETRPLNDNSNEAERGRNRRVAFTINN